LPGSAAAQRLRFGARDAHSRDGDQSFQVMVITNSVITREGAAN
jgi:hypothetical protein